MATISHWFCESGRCNHFLFFFQYHVIACPSFFWLCLYSWHLCFSQVTRSLQRYSPCNGEDLVLCNRTIRENLLYGCDTEPNDADARQALRAAQCEDRGFYKVGVGLGVGDVPLFVRICFFLFTCNLWFFGFGSCFFFPGRKTVFGIVPHHFCR